MTTTCVSSLSLPSAALPENEWASALSASLLAAGFFALPPASLAAVNESVWLARSSRAAVVTWLPSPEETDLVAFGPFLLASSCSGLTLGWLAP